MMLKRFPLQSQQMQAAGNPSLLLVDKIVAMKRSEQSSYLYRSYLKPPRNSAMHVSPEEFSQWRDKICHWAFSVIDHFELSRRTVAICIDIFDRYLATQGNRCDGTQVLLISLTTLYIAIKVNEKKVIDLSTIAELSGGRFSQSDVEEMELQIMQSLCWLLHPPIPVDFISYILKFLPPNVSMPVRHKIFELARYMGELSICDPFFVEIPASTIAFSAILNVLEDDISYDLVCWETRQRFFIHLYRDLNLCEGRVQVREARDRLRATSRSASEAYFGATDREARDLPELIGRTASKNEGKKRHCYSVLEGNRSMIDNHRSKKSSAAGKVLKRSLVPRRKSFVVTPCSLPVVSGLQD